MGISLTSSMRSNLQSLQAIAGNQNVVQNRLASGLKVSSAIDNAGSYYAAISLNNRSADLSTLLDSMSQGIQIIKTTTQALQTVSNFLEQATAVAVGAMEGAPVKLEKSWFEQQAGVTAVVSSATELKAAVASGKTGNIVVYGNIKMNNESITLQIGQNLVGVGYFAGINANATDSEINKFSRIDFDFSDGIARSGVTLQHEEQMITDLSLNVTGKVREDNGVILAKNRNLKLNNLDLSFAINYGLLSDPTYFAGVLSDRSANSEITGLNNIRDLSTLLPTSFKSEGLRAGSHTMRGKLNIMVLGPATHSSSLEIYGQLNIVNLKATTIDIGLYGGRYNVYGNAEVNINTTNIGIQEVYLSLHDNAKLNVKTNNVAMTGSSIVQSYGAALNITSPNVIVNFDAPNAFRSTAAGYIANISAVKGAKIATRTGTFTAETACRGLVIIASDTTNDLPSSHFSKDVDKQVKLRDDFEEIFANIMKENNQNKFPYSQFSDIYQKLANSEKSSSQYNSILKQMDKLVNDSTYKGVNLLLKQNLRINFSESQSSKIEVKGVDASKKGLGMKDGKWESQNDISKSIDEIKNALNQIRGFSEEFGNYYSIVSTREDFTKSIINVLTEGADKLILADMNQESANMLALQTRQQLAVNSLSLASQASQSVLKLF